MSDGDVRAVNPSALPAGPAKRFAYSYGVAAGEVLHISGMVAFDADGEIVGEGDPVAQATQVFENLRAVLEAAGGSLEDLVETTTYLTDMAHSLAVNEVRAQYLTGAVPPTSTIVGAAALARPAFLVEISGTAVLRAGRT